MKTTFYIARRYAFSRNKVKAINIIMLISAVGIIVSSMALFIVLSVFSGLEKHTLSMINDFDADMTVSPSTGKKMMVDSLQLQAVAMVNGVQAVSRVVEEKVVFVYGDKQLVGNIKAVDQQYTNIVKIKEHLVQGDWLQPYSNQVVLGNAFAQQLAVSMYSSSSNGPLQVLAMKPGKGAITMPHQAYNRISLTPTDLYMFQNIDLDAKYVYADLNLGLRLLSMSPDEVSKIEIKLTDDADESEVVADIQQIFDHPVKVRNKIQNNESLYKMLQTERLAVYLIFSLVIAVTLFCLAGALIMIVLEKKSNFKTLSAIGLNIRQLKQIILYQGLILSIGGALVGILIGFVVVWTQYKWEWLMINEQMPYPVDIKMGNFIAVMVTLLILGFVASLFASSRVKNN